MHLRVRAFTHTHTASQTLDLLGKVQPHRWKAVVATGRGAALWSDELMDQQNEKIEFALVQRQCNEGLPDFQTVQLFSYN